ncbi:hypothetical protein [Cohnella boryungensis]|uniref:Uncharacterized protein n=1 Tax=Cohnella boryungensis TaxID=768479 RepID=A0ABV8S7A1_9BACL
MRYHPRSKQALQLLVLTGVLVTGGCQFGQAREGAPSESGIAPSASAAIGSTSPSASAVSSERLADSGHNPSIWDELAAKHPDSTGPNFMAPDSPEAPDLFWLYLDGLIYPNAYVQWYASNQIVPYAEHPGRSQAIEALGRVAESGQAAVKDAAQFALDVFQRDFAADTFSRSPDGKFAAFHLFNEARYNDGRVWIHELERGITYRLDGEWLSVERLVWSPDGKGLAIEYGGRISGGIDLVDVDAGRSVLADNLYEYLVSRNAFQADRQPRPDPYFRLVEWSPEGSRALLSYSITDNDGHLQKGIVVYDLSKQAYVLFKPSAGQEGEGNSTPEKPQDFAW